MALKPRTAAAAPAATATADVVERPPFELEDEGGTTVAEAPAAPAQPAAAAAAAAVQASTAIAKAATTAVARPAPVNTADYDLIGLLEDRLPPVDYGEGVRLIASNGNVMDGDKKMLGGSVKLRVLSWNKRWVISPSDQGSEAKEHARYSNDGVTTTKGEDVQDYLRDLRDVKGYKKAAIKEYVDLFGLLEESEKPTDHIGTALSMQLSPDSVKMLNTLRRDIVVQGMLGKVVNTDISMGLVVTATAVVKSGNGNTWTRFEFKLAS